MEGSPAVPDTYRRTAATAWAITDRIFRLGAFALLIGAFGAIAQRTRAESLIDVTTGSLILFNFGLFGDGD